MTTSQYSIRELADTIRGAIHQELKVATQGIPFRVGSIARQDSIVSLVLSPALDTVRRPGPCLDELFEDCKIFSEDYAGAAEIISVLPAISQVHTTLFAGIAPAQNELVFIKPAAYLDPLAKLWDRPPVAEQAVHWYYRRDANSFEPGILPGHSPWSRLRPAQQSAFNLVGWDRSYLWGPPGTGKTTTLGSVLASYLKQNAGHRVLLISTTNSAVDLALLSVDQGLRELYGEGVRPSCLRFGTRFDPTRYIGRERLIPVEDKKLVTACREHLRNEPPRSDPDAYARWKAISDSLRKKISDQNKQYLRTARLAAMTATYATFQYDDLAEPGPYDFIVFDEASQIGKAVSMTLACLGKRSLFAGDSAQLSPIVQSSSDAAKTWLGKSFTHKTLLTQADPAAVCTLNEQFRMAEPISRAVSTLFYESKLSVATPVLTDTSWLDYRTAKATRLLPTGNVVPLSLSDEAIPADKYNGYRCERSAEVITALVLDLKQFCPDEKVLILTPYRAQRREIEKQLQSKNLSCELVSTVHRAQGSEKCIVIFDPVRPKADFVRDEEGQRLLNVAFSRAKCRLVVILQRDYVENKILNELAKMFPPIPVNYLHVEQILNARTPPPERSPKAEVPRIATIAAPPKPAKTLAQKFQAELHSILSAGPHTSHYRRQVLNDLAGRAMYRKKITYAEMETARLAVWSELPPVRDK